MVLAMVVAGAGEVRDGAAPLVTQHGDRGGGGRAGLAVVTADHAGRRGPRERFLSQGRPRGGTPDGGGRRCRDVLLGRRGRQRGGRKSGGRWKSGRKRGRGGGCCGGGDDGRGDGVGGGGGGGDGGDGVGGDGGDGGDLSGGGGVDGHCGHAPIAQSGCRCGWRAHGHHRAYMVHQTCTTQLQRAC